MQEVREITRQFKGMNLLVPPESLPPDMFLVDQNGDRRRGMSWRVRPGYRRLFSGISLESWTTLATDDFNRTDGASGANWTDYAANYEHEVKTNRFEHNDFVPDFLSPAHAMSGYTGVAFGNDHSSEMDLVIVSGNGGGPACRVSASGCYVGHRNVDWKISKVDSAGVETDLVTVAGAASVNARLEAIGSTIKLYLNGVLTLTVVDTTYATGVPGAYTTVGGTVIRYDNWEGQEYSNPQIAVKAAGTPRHLLAFERDDNEAQLLVASPGVLEAFETGTPEGV